MWMIAVLMIVTSALAFALGGTSEVHSQLAQAEATTIAETMAMYRTAAVLYSKRNRTADQTLPDSALILPPWIQRNKSVVCVITSTVVAVYYRDEQRRGTPGIVAAMDSLSQHSIMVGTAHQASGTLVSPTAGDTGISVPRSIPDGAPTWLADTAEDPS
jgi:PilM